MLTQRKPLPYIHIILFNRFCLNLTNLFNEPIRRKINIECTIKLYVCFYDMQVCRGFLALPARWYHRDLQLNGKAQLRWSELKCMFICTLTKRLRQNPTQSRVFAQVIHYIWTPSTRFVNVKNKYLVGEREEEEEPHTYNNKTHRKSRRRLSQPKHALLRYNQSSANATKPENQKTRKRTLDRTYTVLSSYIEMVGFEIDAVRI